MVGSILLALSCAAHAERSGMVMVRGDGAELREMEGRTTNLALDGDARWLLGCDGCEVTVSGRRSGNKLSVEDFEIRRAGDGSQPFVGVLKRYGAQLSIDDRTTGQHVYLDPVSVGGLLRYEGHPVLVMGFVVGAQTVRVMGFRVLDDPTAADVPPAR